MERLIRHARPRTIARILLSAALLAGQDSAPSTNRTAADPWVVHAGSGGIGQGQRVVFVTGDEEYRSEEGMPQLARILARLGFHCTVLFAIDKKTGAIDPGVLDNIPGLEALAAAELMVIFTRFRDLPDWQMRHIAEYVESGRPIVGLRTATHAFWPKTSKTYERYGWQSKSWPGGFGKQVLGETWVSHHGAHGTQSTLGILQDEHKARPVLLGVSAGTVWDTTDVYTVTLPLPEDCTPVVLGQVLAGMTPDSGKAPAKMDPRTGKSTDPNDPMMPVAWTRDWKAPNGKSARVFATTLGASQGFVEEGTRRLLINACLWALGKESEIGGKLDVSLAGEYAPTAFGFGKHKKGVVPADLAWKAPAVAEGAASRGDGSPRTRKQMRGPGREGRARVP